MQTPYTLLCSMMYRYTPLIRHSALPRPLLQMELLETRWTFSLDADQYLVSSLEENYGITDLQSMESAVESLLYHQFYERVAQAICIEMFQQDNALWRNKDDKTLIDKYSARPTIEKLLHRINIDKLAGAHIPDGPERVAYQLRREGIDDSLTYICDNFSTLLPYVEGIGLIGFDVARVIEIYTKAENLGIITPQQLNRALTPLGQWAQGVFGSWECFLASCILGKMYMTALDGEGDEKPFVKKATEYINDIYALITSPAGAFLKEHPWPESNLENFIRTLGRYVPEGYREELDKRAHKLEETEEPNALLPASIAYQCLVYPAIISGADYYLLRQKHFGYRPLYFDWDETTYPGCFHESIAKIQSKYNLHFDESEIPFACSQKARWIFTNKRIYHLRSKWLLSHKIQAIEWRDAEFAFSPNGSQSMDIKICGHTLAHPQFSKDRLGGSYSTMDILAMDSATLCRLLQQDIDALDQAFTQLKTRLSTP